MSQESDVKYGVSKYQNMMGITCYMNSILHILQQTPIFTEYISQGKFRSSIIRKIEETIKKNPELKDKKEQLLGNFVIFELYKLFKISLENDDLIITPNTFKSLIGKKNDMWNEMNQQDSQEFFNFLISQLEEENGMKYEFIPGKLINSTVTSENIFNNIMASRNWLQYHMKEYSPLKKIFNGLVGITKKCMCCQSIKNVFEPFITLSLSIPIKDKKQQSNDMNNSFSIYDCLDNMIQEEQLDGDNMIICDLCGLKNKAFSKSLLWELPQILVINIKRFINNSFGIPIQKLTNNVDYPFKNLDLSKYFNSMSPHKNKCKYDLFGVNIHQSIGRNINFGHYTAMVKNMINHKWHLYNDSNKVIEIINKKQLQNPNAYLLFYYCQN